MTNEEMIKIAEENIGRLENNDFTFFFFVLDTKGNPSSALEYIYQTALTLQKKGYNVKMLHNEKEFIGVGDWLGKEYAELPHANVEKENVEISASDFLFIPEIFANVVMQTKKLPCKRILIVQNANHVTEFMPVSQSMENLRINDAIFTTKAQKEKFEEWFPMVRSHVVSPAIRDIFKDSDAPRKLMVNIISKEQSDVNRIVKPFYWKNPLYKFISFRDLRGLDQETFAQALQDAAITIWVDDKTAFGYSLLEALRCGSLVMAKVPDELSDWMIENGSLNENVIWFDGIDDVVDMISSAVRSWTLDKVPADVYESQKQLSVLYTEQTQEAEIEQVYVKEILNTRINEFKEVLGELLSNKEETKE